MHSSNDLDECVPLAALASTNFVFGKEDSSEGWVLDHNDFSTSRFGTSKHYSRTCLGFFTACFSFNTKIYLIGQNDIAFRCLLFQRYWLRIRENISLDSP
jgi:hypothetical protein